MVTSHIADSAAPLFILGNAADASLGGYAAPVSQVGTFSALRQTMRRVLRASQARLLSMWGDSANDALETLEDALLAADVGPSVAAALRKVAEDADPSSRPQAVLDALSTMLKYGEKPLHIDVAQAPFVMLFVGVNGTGKTTTIGKYAARLQAMGAQPLLVAGDTFRAAAVQQLRAWGDRSGVPVVHGADGCDAAGLLFDACEKARSQGYGVVLADTAGRLHNKRELTDELRKMLRVVRKFNPTAPHEILLVLDATTGQNALTQAEIFRDMCDVTGFIITKLDGSAKGGIAPALTQKMRLPIVALSTGEGIDDIYPFSADAYARALLPE